MFVACDVKMELPTPLRRIPNVLPVAQAAASISLLPRRYDLDPDTSLMLDFAQGGMASFDLLVQRHRASVVSHLYRLVRSRDIAEELAQDVFIRVFRARIKYRPNAKFTTWLFHITTNVGLNWQRDTWPESGHLSLQKEFRGGRKLQVRDPAPRADEQLLQQCSDKEIRDAIQALPPKQLAAVLLHKYEGLEYSEIAQVLGCSIQALKSLLFRAYETLRHRLAHLDADPPTGHQRCIRCP